MSKVNFEEAIQKLQNTVKSLESGDLSLEDALKQFEEGIALTKRCQDYLKEAETRIEVLTKMTASGEPVTEKLKDGNSAKP